MADSTHSRRILLGHKARKRKTRLLVHRKTNQFKDFVKLLHESHARVATKVVAVADTSNLELVKS